MTKEYYCESTDTKIVYDYLNLMITINDKAYIMVSDELSCGEWEDCVTRELSNYIIKDLNNIEYRLRLFEAYDDYEPTISYTLHTL